MYGKLYTNEQLEYIKEHFFEFLSDFDAPDLIMQIYSELEIVDKKHNRYNEYLNMIHKNFNINCNILEVGGGFIPAFANLVAPKQLKSGNGTITVYDPELITTESKHKNLTLVREKLGANTDIRKYDLIVGIMPCEATELILEKACENNKDFFIALCGCVHLDFYDSMLYGINQYKRYLLNKTKKLLEEYNNGTLCETSLAPRFKMEYPIIYNKKS